VARKNRRDRLLYAAVGAETKVKGKASSLRASLVYAIRVWTELRLSSRLSGNQGAATVWVGPSWGGNWLRASGDGRTGGGFHKNYLSFLIWEGTSTTHPFRGCAGVKVPNRRPAVKVCRASSGEWFRMVEDSFPSAAGGGSMASL